MLAATDGLPLNFGFTGKGNDAGEVPLEEIVKAGACGLKLHEDWGATPATIVTALDVGDKYDVQVRGAPSTTAERPVTQVPYIPIGEHSYGYPKREWFRRKFVDNEIPMLGS